MLRRWTSVVDERPDGRLLADHGLQLSDGVRLPELAGLSVSRVLALRCHVTRPSRFAPYPDALPEFYLTTGK